MTSTEKELHSQYMLNKTLLSFNNVKDLYDRELLYIRGKIVSEKILGELKLLVKNVIEVYDCSWDFDFNIVSKLQQKYINIRGIVIHFEDITIHNKNKNKHNIKDLYTLIRLYSPPTIDKLTIEGVSGMRATLSFAEFCSRYSHSHMPSKEVTYDNVFEYNTFCTGSGDINLYMSDINSGLFTQENILKFLLILHTLVSYESIEGNPHMYITGINIPGREPYSYYLMTVIAVYEDIISKHRNNSQTPQLDFCFENNSYSVKDNHKLRKFIFDYMNPRVKESILCTLDADGFEYKYTTTAGLPDINIPVKSFIFRGNSISFKVVDTPVIESQVEYSIARAALETIKKEINYDINKKTIRKSTFDRYQD